MSEKNHSERIRRKSPFGINSLLAVPLILSVILITSASFALAQSQSIQISEDGILANDYFEYLGDSSIFFLAGTQFTPTPSNIVVESTDTDFVYSAFVGDKSTPFTTDNYFDFSIFSAGTDTVPYYYASDPADRVAIPKCTDDSVDGDRLADGLMACYDFRTANDGSIDINTTQSGNYVLVPGANRVSAQVVQPQQMAQPPIQLSEEGILADPYFYSLSDDSADFFFLGGTQFTPAPSNMVAESTDTDFAYSLFVGDRSVPFTTDNFFDFSMYGAGTDTSPRYYATDPTDLEVIPYCTGDSFDGDSLAGDLVACYVFYPLNDGTIAIKTTQSGNYVLVPGANRASAQVLQSLPAVQEPIQLLANGTLADDYFYFESAGNADFFFPGSTQFTPAPSNIVLESIDTDFVRSIFVGDNSTAFATDKFFDVIIYGTGADTVPQYYASDPTTFADIPECTPQSFAKGYLTGDLVACYNFYPHNDGTISIRTTQSGNYVVMDEDDAEQRETAVVSSGGATGASGGATGASGTSSEQTQPDPEPAQTQPDPEPTQPEPEPAPQPDPEPAPEPTSTATIPSNQISAAGILATDYDHITSDNRADFLFSGGTKFTPVPSNIVLESTSTDSEYRIFVGDRSGTFTTDKFFDIAIYGTGTDAIPYYYASDPDDRVMIPECNSYSLNGDRLAGGLKSCYDFYPYSDGSIAIRTTQSGNYVIGTS